MIKVIGAIVLSTFSVNVFAGEFDLLDQKIVIPIQSTQSTPAAVALDKTMSNLREMLQKFRPRLESSSRLTLGPIIGGSETQPTLHMVLYKCVLVFCKTVSFYGQISAVKTQGSCVRNYDINTNLKESGSPLTDSYDGLKMSLCLNQNGMLNVSSVAHRSPSYSEGRMQEAIFHSLQLQIQPLTLALRQSLVANE